MSKFSFAVFLFILLLSPHFLESKTQTCKPSGKVKGKKPPRDHCNEDDSFCCIEGKYYATYKCSPAVTRQTKAVLSLDSFEKGGDDNGPSKCDNKYHSDDVPIVSLSTGWYSEGSRCLKNVTISGNERSVKAMVVDECDSSMGCDAVHDYLPPCANNIVIASKAVWKALAVPLEDWDVALLLQQVLIAVMTDFGTGRVKTCKLQVNIPDCIEAQCLDYCNQALN